VREDLRWLVIPGAVASILAYVVLVVFHRRAAPLSRYIYELKRLNQEALDRLDREWSRIPNLSVAPRSSEPRFDEDDEDLELSDRWTRVASVSIAPPDRDHPYAEDLDLFGFASVFQLICTAVTPLGRNNLREWLINPAEPETVVLRQEAVAELLPRIDLREELIARGRLIGRIRRPVIDRFSVWTGDAPWMLERRWLLVFAWMLPLLTVSVVSLQVVGVLPYHLWALTVLACGVVWQRYGAIVEDAFKAASSGEAALRRFSVLFRAASDQSYRTPLLQGIGKTLDSDGNPAYRQMKRLERILACSDVRFSGLLHGLLQLATLWDLHVLFALERWREANRKHVASWFSAYGQLEALSSLAGLAHSHPTWVFPQFTSDGTREFVAKDLGHPLLAPDDCVVNDVTLGPPGEFLLLTGSNMSGKSTLLRAIGVNVVLAQAGAPVCASSMRLPSVRVFTAMHVLDSLTQGVSQFMAALNRLKLVVESARSAESDGVAFMYLLDEILQGTNAAERQIAVRRIVRHMLEKGAIGPTSTHDLTLADSEDLESAARLVHFQETIEQTANGPSISFDYKLIPGLATSTNALRLMDIVGL
jgi:ABC-type multidrug transport system fused ATPase/permease subunit